MRSVVSSTSRCPPSSSVRSVGSSMLGEASARRNVRVAVRVASMHSRAGRTDLCRSAAMGCGGTRGSKMRSDTPVGAARRLAYARRAPVTRAARRPRAPAPGSACRTGRARTRNLVGLEHDVAAGGADLCVRAHVCVRVSVCERERASVCLSVCLSAKQLKTCDKGMGA